MSRDTSLEHDNWLASPFGEWESADAGNFLEAPFHETENFGPDGNLGDEEDLAVLRPNRAAATAASAAFSVVITGSTTGTFVAEPDAKEGFLGLSFTSEVTTARDVATGMSSGRRQYGPLVVRKRFGPSTPQIFQSLVTNEVLPKVEINFKRLSAAGTPASYYTVTLINARVAAIRQYSGGALGRADGEVEDVTFAFQAIRTTHLAGGITAEDQWQANR